ncbi:MAG: hypothetical protein R3F08_14715 [Dokdonella sp.]|nr:hypothetical protein [Xanthomonadales bacterium]MCB1573851.1 hypothetical protein [Xanthomonadales bacterium]
MNENDNDALTRLYRDAAREKSPTHLDARILQAAARHARMRRVHLRLRKLAIAAVVAGMAVAIPRWVAHESTATSDRAAPAIARNSALAQAVMDLQAPEMTRSSVTRCLLRSDLCANELANRR